MNNNERFSTYMALDGPHLDGLIGSAGMLRFDWPERKFYIHHYEGISAAHNVSLAPNGELALLGNFSQQLVLVNLSNPQDMRIVARQATQYFEECSYRLRSNTHHLWYPDNEQFIGPIGDNLYRFHVDKLKEDEQLGPHYLFNAHEIRWDPSRRYVLIGDLGPVRRKQGASLRAVAVDAGASMATAAKKRAGWAQQACDPHKHSPCLANASGGGMAYHGRHIRRSSFTEGNYLVPGNRGYNVVSVYDRETSKNLNSKLLPFRRDKYIRSPHYRLGWRGYHLGFHHGEVMPR